MRDGYLVAPLQGVSLRLCVPETDEPSVRAIRSGQYPPALQGLLAVLRSSVDPPARVLDLGGYVGAFGLAAAAAGYSVVIVEANADNVAWIDRSIDANQLASRVRVLQTAVGEVNGYATFHAEGPYGHVQPDASEGTRVRQMTLPAVIAAVDWESVDFIKMDVEGSEGRVFRGAGEWLASGHRPVVLYEANGHTLRWFGDSPLGLRRFLAKHGYIQYEVQDDGRLRQPSHFEPRVVMDYLASTRPLSPVLPSRTPWQVARRTAAALARQSRPARVHVWRALVDAVRWGRV
jgi:FkbM family methyltransferase